MTGCHGRRRFFALLVVHVVLGGIGMDAVFAGEKQDKADPTTPRYNVRIDRNRMIPMRDGQKLAADLLMPDEPGKYPVILEYIPYRKDDVSRGALDALHYFAERGFVAVRLDVRGTGGSDGVNTDEYHPQEQEDGLDAVEWLGTQPWSNGSVGMFGTSYGGFTCVQVAMHRPKHLKGIAPMYATDDRYTDDCHYTPGGNMRMYYDVGTYGGSMVAMNALPPSQDHAGPEWAKVWKDRLEKNEPYLLKWMQTEHQVDGPYWRSASLRPNYDRIVCPTLLIAGWHDGYANAMLRMYTELKCPKKLLMGPWVHSRPNVSTPGPRIDYLHEVVRFFAETLAGQKTGSLSEPPVAVYMQEYAPPSRTLANVPGAWRREKGFGPKGGGAEPLSLAFYLDKDSKLTAPWEPVPKRENDYEEFEYVPTVGTANGFWSAGGISFYLPDDQRADEAYSLNFTTAPLPAEKNASGSENLNILGWPEVTLYASSTAGVATFVAKLSDVAPDGASALITDGSLNVTRRNSLKEPERLPDDKEPHKLVIRLAPTGWVLKPGHRLRLSISGSDFPNLWPTPEKGTHRVYFGTKISQIVLPVVPDATLAPPEFLPSPKMPEIVKGFGKPAEQLVTYDQILGTVTMFNHTAGSTLLDEQRGMLISDHSFRCTASSKDPAQASIVGIHKYALSRDGDVIDVTAESSVRATATTFHILINLNVTKNGQTFFQKSWTESYPRKML